MPFQWLVGLLETVLFWYCAAKLLIKNECSNINSCKKLWYLTISTFFYFVILPILCTFAANINLNKSYFRMKEFLKYTLATVTGMVLFFAIVGVLGLFSLVGMVSSSQSAPKVSDNSVFVLSLSGVLNERESPNIMGQLTGSVSQSIGLDDVLSSIRKAKDNDKIKGIYIEAGLFSPDSPASTQAIRDQLADFKKSGKWIVAYGDAYTQSCYYICSIADKVFLNPQGVINWQGQGGSMMFFKDMLAKFGVKIQLSKVGKYKSAPEMFTEDKMSEPNREQTMAYLTGIWSSMVGDVAQSRNVSKEQLNAYADSMIAFAEPAKYVNYKLVDKLLYADEARAEVKTMLGIDKDDKISQLTLSDMTNIPATKQSGDQIAVYYAYGTIYDTTPVGFNTSPCIAADKVCKDLEKLADDDDVKAVVLRVNSGGGSAYASELIWHSVVNLKKRKPVVVSMGGMAASGGYYLSCGADYIFAEPTTLTGSIGIFAQLPDLSGLMTEKLGIKFDEVKTNKHSAFGTMARPFNEEEMAIINASVERGYNLFLKRVAEGRGMSVAQVDEIAQGRVWLGSDALKIKLIDSFGSVYNAIDKAAELAKVDEHYAAAYPALAGWMEQLLETATGKGSYLDERMKETLGEYYEPFVYLKTLNSQNAIQARLPFVLVTK